MDDLAAIYRQALIYLHTHGDGDVQMTHDTWDTIESFTERVLAVRPSPPEGVDAWHSYIALYGTKLDA